MALDNPAAPARRSRGALAGYVLVWLVGAAAVVAVVAAVLGGRGDETVALPPVRQIELASAARSAGCELRRARPDEATNPPVDGVPAATPEPPGVKDDPPAVPSLIAALRHGVVVIHYEPGLADDRVDELRTMQEAVPEGTIVTPNGTGMAYAVAATGYRRLLGCARFTDATLDALQLFRGKFVGSGPGG
jgi:hypothetical protein